MMSDTSKNTEKTNKSEVKLTPMMEQYMSLRATLPEDTMLFFRLGDFYELFFEDAINAAEILGISLTKRHDTPMCGVPYHAAAGYLPKLVKAGKRVAIAEQTTAPQVGKIVERKIAQLISPGTLDQFTLLDDKSPNFMACVYQYKQQFGLAYIDHSTGAFNLSEYSSQSLLEDELFRLKPSELILSSKQFNQFSFNSYGNSSLAAPIYYESYAFEPKETYRMLCEQFKVKNLRGYGAEDWQGAIVAGGALLHYIEYQLQQSTEHISTLHTFSPQDFLSIDSASQRNLDLVQSSSNESQHTLLKTLDNTITPMGARKLRDWVLHPLIDLAQIKSRQNFVATLIEQPALVETLKQNLAKIKDIERTLSRLTKDGSSNANARDLIVLKQALEVIPTFKQHLCQLTSSQLLNSLLVNIHELPSLCSQLSLAIVDEPPATIKDGGMFAPGFNAELDELNTLSQESKQWLNNWLLEEKERSGIESLKIKYNNVFGYFIEVTKTHLAKVPEHYIRKQTLSNVERFITDELKTMEDKILSASERAKQLELELFEQLRQQVKLETISLQSTADTIAIIDVLMSFAEQAQAFNYCCPQLDDSTVLMIENGRHPVIEVALSKNDEFFIANDISLDEQAQRLMLLTGPNMAGKSTYIRQIALITIMAQLGSYVPASSAHIGLVNKIFCRVGASDNLAQGQSTFMVEMSETALITNHADHRSLVLLDEIGRGTATFDGLSIAWSVAEHLRSQTNARTLFATHYHELTQLSSQLPGVFNAQVTVKEHDNQILFLRKVISGSANRSYGIEVARMAGLPDSVIKRSKQLLNALENGQALKVHQQQQFAAQKRGKKVIIEEENLFDNID